MWKRKNQNLNCWMRLLHVFWPHHSSYFSFSFLFFGANPKGWALLWPQEKEKEKRFWKFLRTVDRSVQNQCMGLRNLLLTGHCQGTSKSLNLSIFYSPAVALQEYNITYTAVNIKNRFRDFLRLRRFAFPTKCVWHSHFVWDTEPESFPLFFCSTTAGESKDRKTHSKELTSPAVDTENRKEKITVDH